MAIIGRAVIGPCGKGHDRAIRNECVFLQKLMNNASAGVPPAAKARRPKSGCQKRIINRSKFCANQIARQVMKKACSGSWCYVDREGWSVPGMNVHSNFDAGAC